MSDPDRELGGPREQEDLAEKAGEFLPGVLERRGISADIDIDRAHVALRPVRSGFAGTRPAGRAVGALVGDAASLVDRLRAHRWQIAAIVVALAVVVAGKQYYRHASAGELRWILAPTAQLAGALGGGDFVYEAGAGWIDRDLRFVIAPPCAGLHFALAAFLALALGALPAMRTPRAAAVRLALAAALAYVATLVVNTARIAIAIAMHRGTIDVGALDRGEVHRIEGIVVYLGGLCALYALARAVHARRRCHELAR